MHDLCNLCRCTQAAVAACLVACIAAAAGSPVPETGGLRLRVNGSNLIDPTSGQPVRLTGFNWPLEHVHDGDGAYMKSLLPGANVARILGLLWDNTPGTSADCMTDVAPYVKESCLTRLDWALTQATSAGVWAIITCRAEVAAGQHYQSDPGSDVFHNATLRQRMYAMWAHVAARYAGWDMVAAYEIMSEPRDKAATATQVRDFYAGGCAAVHAVDPATPCMVGSRDYYKLWTFVADEVIIPNDDNVVYTFDYFVPTMYSFGEGGVTTYPGDYPCKLLYPGWSDVCCPKGANKNMTFNAAWDAANLDTWALPVRDAGVPIVIDQWSVVHGVPASAGRYQYMTDLSATLQQLGIGWMWWVWRGGGGSTWSHGSSEFVYDCANGTISLDNAAFAAVRGHMSDSDHSSSRSRR